MIFGLTVNASPGDRIRAPLKPRGDTYAHSILKALLCDITDIANILFNTFSDTEFPLYYFIFVKVPP